MGLSKPGVAGWRLKRAVGVVQDPAGAGFGRVPEGNDYKGGTGAGARGTLPPSI